jgi:hypothetical protein
MLPFGIIYFMSGFNFISLSTTNIIIIAIVVLIAHVILYFGSTSIFPREEILTRWR